MSKTLKEALLDASRVDGIVTGGTVPLEATDTVWIDLFGYTIARNLDSTRGHIDYNYDDATVDYDDSADITNNRDAITINYQLNHNIDRETTNVKGRPHFHWLQTVDADVAWVWQYRVLENGKAPTAWSTQAEVTAKVFPFITSGITQVTGLGDIDINGVSISSILQIRLWRNGSSANDTYGSTKAQVLSSDMHVPVKYLGSKDEFIQ